MLTSSIEIRPMRESDVVAASLIVRLAFGTYLGVPDPKTFGGDSDSVAIRFRSMPDAAFVAEDHSEILGAVLAAKWGSVSYFGPLVVHPDFWDCRIGQRLLHPIIDLFDRWQPTLAGLFTFSNSPKHLALYQKFGFLPRTLTALTMRTIENPLPRSAATLFSTIAIRDRPAWINGCRDLTNAIYEGLDVASEINCVADQAIGDTVILGESPDQIEGFAICQAGPRTEAGSGFGYVKFAALHPKSAGEARLQQLVDAAECVAASRGALRLIIGVNTARTSAYQSLLRLGFRVELLGVVMHKPNIEGYDRPDDWVFDDWR
jgi:GNAT superfamily N-acetyltransferase